MADVHSPLEQMAGIIEPPFSTAYGLPIAGSGLVLLIAIWLFYQLWRFYKRWCYFAAKRYALSSLQVLANQQANPADINALIKQVIKHYQPQHPALSCNSAQWQQWLALQNNQPLPDLTELLYGQHQNATDLTQFYNFALTWLEAYNGKAETLCACKELKHD